MVGLYKFELSALQYKFVFCVKYRIKCATVAGVSFGIFLVFDLNIF